MLRFARFDALVRTRRFIPSRYVHVRRSGGDQDHYLRRRTPRPPPRPMRDCMPRPPMAAEVRCCWSARETPDLSAAPGCSDCGLLTVSSMERTTTAASAAEARALALLAAGSQILASMVSTTPSLVQSTPYQWRSEVACFWRRALRTSVESKPELSASWRGTTSKAFAKAARISWSFPWTWRARSRRYLERAISTAPPPPTIFDARASWTLFAFARDDAVDGSSPLSSSSSPSSEDEDEEEEVQERLAIMRASWMERCDSSMNCSEPPRRTIVAVLASGHPVKTL
mmetsp:Transcript_16899/g.55001  ORF Transcript_16899/g.55001 Transcript_16899/m.55001 type:complete len:285 (-) Transcript_16899:1176-2030(-)